MGRNEVRWIVGFLVAGAIGLGLFVGLYDRAFPSASLDFKLSRDEAFEAAGRFLASEGVDLKGTTRAMVFDRDDDAQMFLEKRVGLQEANRLARGSVSVWAWRARWYRPEQKEEFRVHLDPGGRVVGFRHLLLDSDAGADLSPESAIQRAETFLRARGFDLAGYDLVEKSSKRQEHRTDHTLTYERRGFRVEDEASGGFGVDGPSRKADPGLSGPAPFAGRDSLKGAEAGTYRLEVVIQGDRAGGFREFLKVPEAFSRRHREVRSRALLLAQVASVLWVALGIAMITVLIRRTREGGMPYRTALWLGTVVAAAWVTGGLNALPITRFSYDTQVSYPSFLLEALFIALVTGIFSGLAVSLCGMSGSVSYAQAFPEKRVDPLGRPAWRRILSLETTKSALIGYGLACFHLGYVTLFYLLGARYLGVWAPAEATYGNELSTSIPWIYAFQIGLTAATMEELFFRLFAISYLKRLFGRTWPAVLIPAVIWAFLHSTYAVEPIYIRGIELTVVGVLFGLVFLRFGIWATIISHYAYDAALVALPMIKSSSLYFQASGVAVAGIALLPVLGGAVAWLVKRSSDGQVGEALEDREEDLEAADPGPEVLTPPPSGLPQRGEPRMPDDSTRAHRPLGPRARKAAIAAGLVGLALAGLARPERFGEGFLCVGISREAAQTRAEVFARAAGLNPEGYRHVVRFQDGLASDGNRFLVANAGFARAESLATSETPPWTWGVRWFQAGQKEEIRVGVDARDGVVTRWSHILPEDRKGADLPAAQARDSVLAFVRERFGKDLSDSARYQQKEASSERRTGRRDHDFVFERSDLKVGEGRFRTLVSVHGDRVDGVAFGFKAPEAYLRQLRRETVKDVAARIGMLVLTALTFVWATVAFVRIYRDRGLTWRVPGRVALVALAASAIGYANGLGAFFSDYDTASDLASFTAQRLIAAGVGICLQAATLGLLLALADGLWRRDHPDTPGPVDILRGGVKGLSPKVLAESLFLAAAFAAWMAGIFRATWWVEMRLFPQEVIPKGWVPSQEIEAYLPFLRLRSVVTICAAALGVVAGVLVWRRVTRRGWIAAVAAGAMVLLVHSIPTGRTFPHFAGVAALDLARVGAMVWFGRWIVRDRLLPYVCLAWLYAFAPPGVQLLRSTALPFYVLNGVAMVLIGLAPVWWYLKIRLAVPRSIRGGS